MFIGELDVARGRPKRSAEGVGLGFFRILKDELELGATGKLLDMKLMQCE